MTAGGVGQPESGRLWAFHDPTAGMGGVVPTRTARLWLAAVGLALCVGSMLMSFQLDMTWAGVLLAALAAVTVGNIGWVVRRRRRAGGQTRRNTWSRYSLRLRGLWSQRGRSGGGPSTGR